MVKLARFPFDVHQWTDHLNTNDPIALIIRGHLYVEAILIQLIEAALIRKEALNVTRLPFPTKINLAVALGQIEPEDQGGYTALNSLRNELAHNLQTQFTDQDELDFYNTFSVEQRKLAERLPRKPEMALIARLRCDLIVLLLNLIELQIT